MRRNVKLWLAIPGCVGILICIYPLSDMLRVEIAARRLSSKQPSVRVNSLRVIAEQRDRSAAPAVFKLLEQENDRDMLEKVGYTAMRIRDTRAVPLLQHRVDSGPDDPTRARLVMYTARVSNRDVRLIDWLNAGVAAPEPWRRAASALGLLELGRIEGGLTLIKMAPALDPVVAAWALKEFRSFAEPMTQIVGSKIDGWKDPAAPPDGPLLNQLKQFWEQYASPSLLTDVLIRRERLDSRWFQLNRLLHAQDQATNWLFSKK